MKSYIAKPAEVQRNWYLVDAEGKTLGRLATEIATILRRWRLRCCCKCIKSSFNRKKIRSKIL